MKKNRMILLLAVVLWLTSSVSAATIDRIAVRSEAMKKEIPVVVIVPDAAKSGVRMPVLYLLHGYSGDQETWLNVKPSLPQMADRDSVIVVCPDGENSWYWDSPKDPSSRFETFVARELIDYVDAGTHRVIMLDTPFAKRLVQFVVHVEKEVVVAAVDHQRQIAVRYAVQLGHHRMVVPRLAVGRLLAELFGHFPVLGERTDIHAAARRSAGAERILVAERKPQPAVAALSLIHI